MKSLVGALLLLAAAAAPAFASPAGFDPKSMAGTWSLSGPSEGDPACTLTFTDEGTIGGWVVKLPKACVTAFPKIREVNAWTLYPDGDIGFVDSMRKTLFKFDKVDDAYITAEDSHGLQLVLSKGGGDRELSAQQRMSGGWSITGIGGQPRCSFTSRAAASGKAGTLTIKPGCAAKWKSAGWASWKQVGQKLTVYDTGGKALQTFTLWDVVTYEGEDARGEPIYFSRD